MTIEELTELQLLNESFYQCSKISHWKESTQRYKANLLIKNTELQNEVRSGDYRVSPTTDFTLIERGKRREIKAPAIRDRILQKALCQKILVPQLTKPLIYDNYASIKGRGTSFARKRFDVLLRKYIRENGTDGYILQIDIKRYFDSIDHEILKSMVHKRIHEPDDVMELIDYVIDTSSDGDKGLNLGAEAPQVFAIYYLSGIDHYIKTVKGVKYYGRYMDDSAVIARDKEELKSLLRDIKTELKKIGLQINDKKTHITPIKHGFTFLQIKYSIQDGKIIKRPTHKKIVRERRRLKKYKKKLDAGIMTRVDIQNAYKSWRGNVIRDHNRCHKTIYEMDKLYKSLFGEDIEHKKQTRTQLINEFYRQKETKDLLMTLTGCN